MVITHDAVKEMVAELRRMSNRTGNKQAEVTMREAAKYLADVETNRIELQNENEKLQQQIADKNAQLAEWKELLDATKAALNAAINCTDEDGTPVKKRRSPCPHYDYTRALIEFHESHEKTGLVPTRIPESGKRIPSAWRFRDAINRLKLPITATAAGEYVLLMRTDAE